MARIKMHIPKAKLPFYPPYEVKYRLQNGVSTGSLDRWLFGLGVLPWSSKFKLIKETAKAVCFLHLKGLAHGNLKTSSVFVDLNYQFVLGDYRFVFFMKESS